MKCANSQMLVARSTPCNGWIRTKTHICEGTKITFLFLQSTRVDYLDAQTSRQISPAGHVDSHNIVCSWCAQAHVSTHSCDFTNAYFQGQEIDRILLYCIPAECIPKKGVAKGSILASRVPVYGTKDAGRGLWLRLNNTCKQCKFSLNQILPTLFTRRNEESNIIAVMSSNVDDFL